MLNPSNTPRVFFTQLHKLSKAYHLLRRLRAFWWRTFRLFSELSSRILGWFAKEQHAMKITTPPALRTFKVVMRAPSGIVFKQAESLTVKAFPSLRGPVTII